MQIACLAGLLVCLAGLPTGSSLADEPATGPTIEGRGPVFAVPADSFNLVPGRQYKVLMDIGAGPENPAQPSRQLESAARFLNMHARNGIAPGDLTLVVVLHGVGARAALTNAAHLEEYGTGNPDADLVRALGKAGVSIYLCGQTAGYRGFEIADLLPQVTLAVSAMTVHVRLQQEGYLPILF